MSKKKRHSKFPAPATGAPAIKQNGLKAFRQADFTSAIAQWSHLNLETEPAARAALAEAHFRRALAGKDPAQRLADLERAGELLPGEGRFWYHLGLMQHRANQLDKAIAAYERARAAGFARNTLGFVHGLAALERDPQIALESVAGLSPDDRAALLPIAALLRRDPQGVLAIRASGWFDRMKDQLAGNPGPSLWNGLAFIAAGQPAQAIEALAPAVKSYRAGAEAVRAFYHGLALAASGQRDAALSEWRSAVTRTPTPRLQSAVIDDQLRQIQAQVEAQHWAAALQTIEAGLKLTSEPGPLRLLELTAHSRLASEAAGQNQWPEAIRHWQTMRNTLEAKPDLGLLTPILHNLAVAHEQLEQWTDAAAAWNALINQLPKRPTKKSQTALHLPLPVPELRTWLRRHILECYKQAGQPDLAITHYRSLVKASPDDLDLRLELAQTLLANDQVIAARNELDRILTKDPRQTEARLLLAEIQHERGDRNAAEQQLRAVLGTDPQHEAARRGLVEILIERGHDWFSTGRYDAAKKIYEEALQLAPHDTQLLVWLGNTELVQRHVPAARQQFDAALSQGDALTYVHVFECWADATNMAEAKQLLARAEAVSLGTAPFYIDIAGVCFKNAAHLESFTPFGPPQSKKAATVDAWAQLGQTVLQKAEALEGDRVERYRQIVSVLGPVQPDIALDYAQKLAALTPEDVPAWIELAILQGLTGQTKVAKDTLRQASRLARKQGNSALLPAIEEARDIINNPFMSTFARMGLPLEDLIDEFDLDDEDLFR